MGLNNYYKTRTVYQGPVGRRFRCFTLTTAVLVAAMLNIATATAFDAHIAVVDSIVPGDTVTVRIDIVPDSAFPSTRLQRLELSIHIDSTVLALNDVTMPAELQEHGWAPPRFYLGRPGEPDCGSAQLTLILTADSRWFESTADSIAAISVDLEFATSHDVTLFGDTSDIEFCWRMCDDNCFYDATEDTSYIAREVFDLLGNRLSDRQLSLPTLTGPPQICYDAVMPIGKSREATIDFYNGAVILASRDVLIERGDVNLDGVANDSLDLTLLGSHCLIGDEAFQVDVERQLAVSDIDEDGIGGTVADWVALRYLIAGQPMADWPRAGPPTAHLHFASLQNATEVYLDSDISANAFALWFQTDGGDIDSVRFSQGYDPAIFEAALTVNRNNLLQVAYSAGTTETPSISAGFTRILTVYHDPTTILTPVHVEVATAEPRLFAIDVATSVDDEYGDGVVPSTFTLHQNYPNPFNPGTEIRFDLHAPSLWRLEIFDVCGRCAREFSSSSQSGVVTVYWDGCDADGRPVASGIYLYRLTAGISHETRRMVLLR